MGNKWQKLRVGEFAEVIGGGTPSTKDPSNFGGKIPWITPKDLSINESRWIGKGERSITDRGLKSSSARLLPKGTVLLTTRAPVGYLAISKNEITTNQGFRSLVLRDGFIPEFVYYLLKNDVNRLKSFAVGTTFQELSGSTLKNMEYSLPETAEQQAIAIILGSLDDKIELNRQINEKLEAIAQALFKSWFVDFDPVRAKAEGRDTGLPEHISSLFPDSFEDSELGQIPEGWRIMPFSSIVKITSGKRPHTREEAAQNGCTVPILGGAGVLGYTNNKLYNEDLIITGRVGTLGKVIRVSGPSWPSDNTLVIMSQENTRDFVYETMKTFDLTRLNRGSTQPLLTQKDLGMIQLVVPPVDLIMIFAQHSNPLSRCQVYQNFISSTLMEIRDALLPKLISGELPIPDAERIVGRYL